MDVWWRRGYLWLLLAQPYPHKICTSQTHTVLETSYMYMQSHGQQSGQEQSVLYPIPATDAG